jgi:hypothetical protein
MKEALAEAGADLLNRDEINKRDFVR